MDGAILCACEEKAKGENACFLPSVPEGGSNFTSPSCQLFQYVTKAGKPGARPLPQPVEAD